MASTTHLRLFCCCCCHYCCCSYVASPVHMFFATTIFRFLSTTMHDDPSDALPHLSSGSFWAEKNTSFASRGLANTNGVNLNHPRWHPCPLQGWKTYWKKKAQLDPTCMLSQLYRLLDFYGAAPHSWQEPVKPFLKTKPFLGLAGVELNATNNCCFDLWPQHIPRICNAKL